MISLNSWDQKTERRSSHRIYSSEVCLVEFLRRGDQTRRLGELKDISLEGLLFASPLKINKKTKLQIFIYFPKDFPSPRPFVVAATVARVLKPQGAERYRIGCKVHHPDEASREKFRQYRFWLDAVTTPEPEPALV